MSSPASPPDLSRDRAKQVFRFLKAYAERNEPSRRLIASYDWAFWLRDIPSHPSITRGQVSLAAESSTAGSQTGESLLTIQRPKTTRAPAPPDILLNWLETGRDDPNTPPRTIESRNVILRGETVQENFADNPDHVREFEAWLTRWSAWAETERPARAALAVFERLYSLRARLEQQSETLELVLGDGRLLWLTNEGKIDHPVLLQRVELEFDASVPEIRLVDADRSAEIEGRILASGEAVGAGELTKLRSELEQRGYHPLEGPATREFLLRIVQSVDARGELVDAWTPHEAMRQPRMFRDPVLFVRPRQTGYAAAFDRVLEHLEGSDPLPVSISALVGVETPPLEPSKSDWSSPWSEPADVFLSKPANNEQVQIAHALERYRAVLVQGPPGTGKSHTIANLIGHLVATGRRVLVTSHTTKALRVLRGSVEEALRPLCVAVLETDLDSRRQMEDSVRGILSRLTTTTEKQLDEEVAELSVARTRLLSEVERCTSELRIVREGEYVDIVVAGEGTAPAEAGRWVEQNRTEHAWIPAPVELGGPLPLSSEEIRELYSSSEKLTPEDEEELRSALPTLDSLPTAREFETLAARCFGTAPTSDEQWWLRAATADETDLLRGLADRANQLVASLERFAPWQRELVAVGHGGTDRTLWESLKRIVDENHAHWVGTRELLLEHECAIKEPAPSDARGVAKELRAHLEAGGSLGFLSVAFNGNWKAFLRAATVNDQPPSTSAHFHALEAWLALRDLRARVSSRWHKQAVPIGLAALDNLPDPFEPSLKEFADQFAQLLSWWPDTWEGLRESVAAAGFRYDDLKQWFIARNPGHAAFARDVAMLREEVLPEISARLALAERDAALRELHRIEATLAPFGGRVSEALRRSVRAGDSAEYERGLARLRDLWEKTPVHNRRVTLLDALRSAAPAWASAIGQRTSPHDAGIPPGNTESAWKWRQLDSELERRAKLDERMLMERLHRLRSDLRGVTTDLIDRRAWLGQKRRVDLPAQQALQGWADVQRKIGKGTGKRVPQLRAEARKLLAKARDAVPVWIMPLSRVAESLDLTRGRFDVVIVDEASQSDVQGLLAWYLGERVAVVGDHEQVSPLAVGQQIDSLNALIAEHLDGVPNAVLYDGKTSIYDLARQSFGGTIALREHFRCVPDIIEFSNHLSYDDKIRPLRDPSRVQRPHVVEVVSGRQFGRGREGKQNESEARWVVALIHAMSKMPAYDGGTFGAISLLGEDQSDLIESLAVQHIGAVELERRHFAAGNPAQFQGDERDVIFLSMVDSPKGSTLRISQDDPTKQRYNVAASRARDQLWLVHSLNPDRDLQAGDLRRRLIDHVRAPRARALAAERIVAKAESPFEAEVLKRLVAAGYEVEPQFWVGGYRIDIVVRSGANQVALECDGDRYHGFDQIPADLARQAVLERVGWRFIRIRGTRFFRDPDAAMREAIEQLERLGIHPTAAAESPQLDVEGAALRNEVLWSAWKFMKEQGWIQQDSSSSIS